ncbi:MAG: hypothetical protein HY744_27210 [Deltaproteobacteria bacterium]|nr:hypothetical protein [Deltaproteobacteria bacterium]
MRRTILRGLAAAVSLGAIVASPGGSVRADGAPVAVLVLKEHGVGSAAQAQPYVDKLVAITAKLNGWPGGKGEYHTRRDDAQRFIAASSPHFGILSLGAFLALKEPNKLDVVGQAEVSRAGGKQYFIISKDAVDLGGCKGKTLASDHADDPRFIEKVVSGGAFKLSDFSLVPTKRPTQTIKKVVSGEAACALIDDAQHADLGHIEGAGAVKAVWKSDKLPPMAIVAFGAAPPPERSAFQASLGKVCAGEGAAVCGEVGLQSLRSAGPGDYAAVVAAYTK